MSEVNEYDFNALKLNLIDKLSLIFVEFKELLGNPPACYLSMNDKEMALAVHNAVGDIQRSTEHHSDKSGDSYGPSDVKIAGFLSKWVAKHRFLYVNPAMPINLDHIKLHQINAKFAVFVAEVFCCGHKIPVKLIQDLRYCFEFRDLSGDVVTLILNHSVILPNESN